MLSSLERCPYDINSSHILKQIICVWHNPMLFPNYCRLPYLDIMMRPKDHLRCWHKPMLLRYYAYWMKNKFVVNRTFSKSCNYFFGPIKLRHMSAAGEVKLRTCFRMVENSAEKARASTAIFKYLLNSSSHVKLRNIDSILEFWMIVKTKYKSNIPGSLH